MTMKQDEKLQKLIDTVAQALDAWERAAALADDGEA